ncbi:multidrug resistance protein Stp [Acidithrix ferrooxidans]|uniref:Multidrug resistance protein Stp n=2 Tax=Acidithrix ferrooxidans TaxID=1280514 RepID=A0A0D8HH88_9ACTN|nr:multidrug resistance protein Stp [Acidithrix ferrooxidans]
MASNGTSLNDLSRSRRMAILAICSMSLFIVGIDNTIINVALPSIGRDLGASVSGLQWTVDAYTLVLASLLMLSGSTGDRLGRRKTFQVGLIVFSLGSLLCSLAPNLVFLEAFRMLQAIGGSMLNPVALSIITNTFTDPKERAQAIGIWGAVIGVSMALGPILGGTLVDSVGWRSIFWINVPIGIAAFILAGRFIPESRADRARKLDPVGQILILVFLASAIFGIIEGPTSGWGSVKIVSTFVIAGVSLISLLIYEPRRNEPLIDLRYFRSIPFSGATVVAVAAFGSLGGFLFMNTLYLQNVRGLSPLSAGIDTLPMAVMTIFAAPLSGRIVGSVGPRIPLLIGGLGIGLSSLALTTLTATTPFSWLFGAYLLFGLGFGLVNAPITNAAVSGMPRQQAGVAAAVASTSRQIGQSLGVAIVGAMLSVAMGGKLTGNLARASHSSWWLLVAFGVCIFCMGLIMTSRVAKSSVERVASIFP